MTELFVGAFVAITVALTGLVSHNFSFFREKLSVWIPFLKYKVDFEKVVSAKIHMDVLTKSLQNRPTIKRAYLVVITNGGSIVKPEGNLYGTIIHPTELTHTFDKQAINSEFMQMVQKVYTNEYTEATVDDLKEHGLLGTMLRALNLYKTHWYSVKAITSETSFSYVFLAVDTEKGQELSFDDNDDIRQVVNVVQKLL